VFTRRDRRSNRSALLVAPTIAATIASCKHPHFFRCLNWRMQGFILLLLFLKIALLLLLFLFLFFFLLLGRHAAIDATDAGLCIGHDCDSCKTAESIETPFRIWTREGERNQTGVA